MLYINTETLASHKLGRSGDSVVSARKYNNRIEDRWLASLQNHNAKQRTIVALLMYTAWNI